MAAPLAHALATLAQGPHDPDAVLSAFLAQQQAAGLTLYPAQEEALLELTAERHVILGTPTGSGKSLVAAYAHFLACSQKRRSFYTCPIKALVSEKFFDLCRALGPERVGMLTGDASINPGAPVVCCTAEVLANMALREATQVEDMLVVMDEFHYFAEPERGRAWELPLLTLGRAQFLLMSATLGDVAPIAAALKGRTQRDVAHVTSNERPVPLDFRYSEVPLTETLDGLLSGSGAPVYVVHFSQREAVEAAQAALSLNFLTKEQKQAIGAELRGFRFDTPFGKIVQRTLLHGVGIHHAGLLPKYRLVTEKLAQQGHLRVLMGTDTLGVGVNVPIRTVLFTRLCKFDGRETKILAVRDFLQIAGRAGRRGFDTQGSVIVQAPEHVIENRRMESRVAGDAKKLRKLVKKKPPQKNFVPWDENTFNKLIASPPEPLSSQFRLDFQLVLECMRDAAQGYRQVVRLIAQSLLRPGQKAILRREAKKIFRTLLDAEVLERHVASNKRPEYRLDETLGEDFSLTHTLGLFVLDILPALRERPEHTALDTLSLIESILESPSVILFKQTDVKKREKLAELRAEGVPYEERIEQLEQVTYDKPLADELYETFDVWRERHPTARDAPLRPKSIARAMAERYASFNDYISELGLERAEGVLLRYLAQVVDALASALPAGAMDDELSEIVAYLEETLAQVDASLSTAYEALVAPEQASAPVRRLAPSPLELLRRQPKVITARIRQRVFVLCQRLAQGAFDEAAAMLVPPPDEGEGAGQRAERWTSERLASRMQEFIAAEGELDVTPRARLGEWTQQSPEADDWRAVRHTLLSEGEPTPWALSVAVHIGELVASGSGTLVLRDFGPP